MEGIYKILKKIG